MIVNEKDVAEVLGPDADELSKYKIMLKAIEEIKGFAFIVGNIKPGGGTKLHTHDDHAEVYYVIKGKAEFQIGSGKHQNDNTMVLYVPPKTEHSMRNVGDTDVKVILLQVPLSK